MDGDIDRVTGERALKAKERIDAYSSRCLDVDVAAIEVGIQAIQLSENACAYPHA